MSYHKYYINHGIEISCMYSIFEQYFAKDYSFPGELHDFWECVYVIDGRINASGDERVYKLEAGDMIFHRPMEFHKFYIDNPKGAKLLIFSFDAKGEFVHRLERKVFHLLKEQKNVVQNLIVYMSGYIDKDVIYTDYIGMFEKNFVYSQMVYTYIVQLFLMLCDNGKTAETFNDYESELFSNAVAFMSDNIDKNFSVEYIAEMCHISTTGLKRIFKKFAGIGVHKYFLLMKMNRGTELLKEGKTIAQIAERLGFEDSGYFSKVYKREMGISPSVIKK